MADIARIVGFDAPCTFEADYEVLKVEMGEQNYGEDRFGEIWYEVYPQQLKEKLESLCGEDAGLAELIRSKWTTRKLKVEKQAMESVYHKCSITAEGDFLIGFRQMWCNLGECGNDIVAMLSASSAGEGGMPYLVAKSIKDSAEKVLHVT